MPGQEQLVFLVEGAGDCDGVPILAKRILKRHFGADYSLRVDDRPLTVGHLSKLTGRHAQEWSKKLRAALMSRRAPGAIVLLLDGDLDHAPPPAPPKTPFCPGSVAQFLAREARHAGAGHVFSVAVVFACPEFESWLIAGREGFADQLKPQLNSPPSIEKRDAKGWLASAIQTSYRPSQDQGRLAKLADLDGMRDVRSFLRFEKTLKLLVEAHARNERIVTPD